MAFNDDCILDRVLEGLTDEYLQMKSSAEKDYYFTLEQAVITMHNIHGRRAMGNEPSLKATGRESVMVVTSRPSAVVTCLHCKMTGHRLENCLKRKGTMSGKTLHEHLETTRGVVFIQIATIIATVGLKTRHGNKICRPRTGHQNGRQ